MARDPYFANAEAEHRGKPSWSPRRPCTCCDTYSLINGLVYCPDCRHLAPKESTR